MMICRKCKEYFEWGDNYVRYGVRHTAHWNCFFEGLTNAEAALKYAKLPQYQKEKVPWKLAERLGLNTEVMP